jgi:CHASE2 domain-containing sensor protein
MSLVRRVRRSSRSVRYALTSVPTGLDWRYRANLLLMVLALMGGFISLGVVFPESWWQDRRFAARVGGPGFTDEVVVIGLDEHFAERYDRPDPTPRDYLARVLAAAAAYDPNVVAFDFRFGPSVEDDPAFAAFRVAARQAASRGVTVVLPSLTTWPEPEIVMAPPASLGGDVVSGLVSFAEFGGETGTAPRLRTFAPITRLADGRAAPSLGFLAVATHRCGAPPDPPVTSRGVLPILSDSAAAAALRCLGVPGLRGETAILLDYAAPPTRRGGLTFYSSEAFLERAETGRFEPSWLAGRIVLVASTYARTDYDLLRTPFGTVRGAMYHVYTMDTLLRGVHRSPHARGTATALSILLFFVVLALWFGRALRAALLTLGGLAVYVLLCFAAFEAAGVLIPIAPPLYAGLLGGTIGFIFHRELHGIAPLPAELEEAETEGYVPPSDLQPSDLPPSTLPPRPPRVSGRRALRRLRAWLTRR